MPRQQLIWIALPNGIAPDGRARVSAFALPRLHPDGDEGRLGDFAFAAWPDHLSATAFAVTAGRRTVTAERTDRVDPALWRVLMPPDLLVRAAEPERLSGAYGDFPVMAIGEHVRALHVDAMPQPPSRGAARGAAAMSLAAGMASAVAVDEADRLALEVLRGEDELAVAAAAARLEELAVERAGAARGRGEPAPVPMVPKRDTLTSAFAQFSVFHERPAVRASGMLQDGPVAPSSRGAVPLPRLDVHQRLTLLADYPEVLRRLGLVVDLLFDVGDADAFVMGGEAGVAVHVALPAALAVEERPAPRTRYRSDGRATFAAAPRGEALVGDGFVDLARRDPERGTPIFAIADFDVTAAALQVLRQRPAAPAGSGPPSLRSTGLTLVQTARAAALLEAADRQLAELGRGERGESPLLSAEDLLRGYRADVRAAPDGRGAADAPWRSLHRRRGVYRILGTSATFAFEDEGVIVPAVRQAERSPAAVATATHDGARADLIEETIFTWSGWSLSAPQPGAPVELDGVPPRPAPLPISVSFTPARRTLPLLRFGTRYQLRLRTADLAGNGPTAEETGPAPVLPDGAGWTYRRFEPVVTPLIASVLGGAGGATPPSADDAVPQDAIDVVVLRGGLDGAADRAERLLLPPVVAQAMAEQLGAFDAADGGRPDAERAFALATGGGEDRRLHRIARDADDLPDPLAAGIAIHGCPGIPPGQVARFEGGRLVVEPLDLPDVVAPDATSLLLVEFTGAPAWPQVDGVRLRLAAGTTPPTFDADRRELTLFLPPAAQVEVGLGCFLRGRELDELALLHWAVAESDGASHRRTLERAATLGLLPTLTPTRPLRLVHAVRQPLAPPIVLAFDPPQRPVGGTAAFLGGRIQVDVASTARIELHASWEDAAGDGGPPRARDALVLSVPLDPGVPDLPAGVDVDAAAGTITLQLLSVSAQDAAIEASIDELRDAIVALGRALASLGSATTDDMIEGLLRMGTPRHAHLARIVEEADNIAQAAATLLIGLDAPDGEGTDVEINLAAEEVSRTAAIVAGSARAAMAALQVPAPAHDFGDQRHRRVTYRVDAVSRFADRYPRRVSCVIGSDPVTVSVPSSAPPLPPRIDRIVPAFGWSRGRSSDGSRFSARESVLRVYLEGPWHSSGEGELLAVVFGIDRPLSWWARDPVFLPPAAQPPLGVEHFAASDFVLPERRVLGYRVRFDDAGECFCDLPIADTVGYAPLVRLALARLQPESIPGIELSDLVLATPVQLPPRRQVTATPRGDGAVTIEVAGVTHRSPHGVPDMPGPTGTVVRVTMQRRLPGTVDDLGWQPVPDAVRVDAESPGPGIVWRAAVTPLAFVGERRLLIQEIERYASLGGEPSPPPPAAERTIFADVIPI